MRLPPAAIVTAVLVLACLPGLCFAEPEPQTDRMLVIGHRGSPGHGDENTVAGFRRAVELGADGIELDLILTADHRLVVFHDWTLNRLVGERQLSERFPDRSRTEDGRDVWRTRDFTLAELQELFVTQEGPCQSDGHDEVSDPDSRICGYADALRFFQCIRQAHPDLVLYTEIKTSSKEMSEDEISLMAELVSDALVSTGEAESGRSHWLQSFDGKVMEMLADDERLESIKKCQLLSCEPGLVTSANPVVLDVGTIDTAEELRAFLNQNVAARDLQMVHGWKLMWWHLLHEKGVDCAAVAHDIGLEIHAFTFRDERYASDYEKRPILAPGGPVFTSAAEEIEYFRSRGFDAVMSDCIESAVR